MWRFVIQWILFADSKPATMSLPRTLRGAKREGHASTNQAFTGQIQMQRPSHVISPLPINLDVDNTVRECLDLICKTIGISAKGCGLALGAAILSTLCLYVRVPRGKEPSLSLPKSFSQLSKDRGTKVRLQVLEKVQVMLRESESWALRVLRYYIHAFFAKGGALPQVIGGHVVVVGNKTIGVRGIGQLPLVPNDAVLNDLLGGMLHCQNWSEFAGPEDRAENRSSEGQSSKGESTKDPIAISMEALGICTSPLSFPSKFRKMMQKEGLVEKALLSNQSVKRGGPQSVDRWLQPQNSVRFYHSPLTSGNKYRQLAFVNKGSSPVFLVKGVCCGANELASESEASSFTLSDDFGICSNATTTDSMPAFREGDPIIKLAPEQMYHLTVIYKQEACVPDPGQVSKVKLLLWSDKNGFEVIERSILVISVVEDKQRDKGGNTEAEPFIAKKLENVFKERFSEVCGVESLPIISHLIASGVLEQPSPNIISTPFTSFAETYANFASKRGGQSMLSYHSPDYQILKRGLLLQEINERKACDKHSMYNINVKVGMVDFDRRRYKEKLDHEEKNGRVLSGPYSGPNLKTLFNGTQDGDFPVLLLEVPNSPEKEPELKTGSLVYMRPAESRGLEVISIVLASHMSTVILLAPDNSLSTFGLRQKFWHVKFSIDHEYYSRLHSSMELVRRQERINGFGRLSLNGCKKTRNSKSSSDLGEAEEDSKFDDTLRIFLAAEADLLNAEKVTFDDVMKTIWMDTPPDKSQQSIVHKVWQSLEEGPCTVVKTRTPHILFKMLCVKGPAGTGKSLTAVNVAAFICTLFQYKILVCTPEEYTADLLAKGILSKLRAMAKEYPWLNMDKKTLLRVNDPKRPISHSLQDILLQCKVNETSGLFRVPSQDELMSAQIVVCSNKTSWLLHQGNINVANKLNFDLVIIDEAGQASVPDALVSLGCLGSKSGVKGQDNNDETGPQKTLLMLGDQHQLGPSKTSNFPSILDCWGNDACCSSPVIQLSRNYRSNEGLLEIPKAMFYGEELNPVAKEEDVKPPDLTGIQVFGDCLQKLNKSTASVLTLGVEGKHSRSNVWSKGKSCFNDREGEAIKDICTQFINKELVYPSQIGIVALSRAQVILVREELRNVGLGDIRCGTVDDFQGQQADVILISCVGTSIEALDRDEKRFNVAITRARRLLIVIGSLSVLQSEDAGPWHAACQMCTDNGVLLELPAKEVQEEAIVWKANTLEKLTDLASSPARSL